MSDENPIVDDNLIAQYNNVFFAPDATWKKIPCKLFSVETKPTKETLESLKTQCQAETFAIVAHDKQLYFINFSKSEVQKIERKSPNAVAFDQLKESCDNKKIPIDADRPAQDLIQACVGDDWWKASLEYRAKTAQFVFPNGHKINHYEFNLLIARDAENRFKADLKAFEAMKDADQEKKRLLWFYLRHFCEMRLLFFKSYHKQCNVELYEKALKDIDAIYENKSIVEPTIYSFLEYFYKDVKKSVVNFSTAFLSSSGFRDNIAYINLLRIYWAFWKATLSKVLPLLRDAGFMDSMEKTLHQPTFDKELLQAMEVLTIYVYVCSVAFFVIKFFINAWNLGWHTFFPRKEEANSTMGERFSYELSKRYDAFGNDGAWGVVNGLTNFNKFFNISDPVAMWLVAGFLFYDLALILLIRHVKEAAYLRQCREYEKEREDVQALLNKVNEEIQLSLNAGGAITAELVAKQALAREYELRLEFVAESLKALNNNWHVKHSTLLFNAAAAMVFALGFSVTIIFASPIVATVSYFLCVVAVAMYLSADRYDSLKEKEIALREASSILIKSREDQVQPEANKEKKVEGAPTLNPNQFYSKALFEYKQARNEFWFKLARNALIPTLLLGAYAICWPAAVALTILFAGYSLYRAYGKYQDQKGDVQPALGKTSFA